MSTLLLRLAGPMQSWGTQSRFSIRDTEREPSKSGVIGLLCAALGRPRWEPLDDLVALRMGVRVDREGSVAVDYQTAGGTHRRGETYGVVRATGAPGGTVVSRRAYLADASYLVGLEASTAEQEALLQVLDWALARPTWPLFLGRKAFVPGEPVRLPDTPPCGPGLRPDDLESALLRYPWPELDGRPAGRLRFVVEAEPGSTAEVRADVPLSFAIGERRFATRSIRTDFRDRPA
jgi:CRISPR system Cascade subunit CasD